MSTVLLPFQPVDKNDVKDPGLNGSQNGCVCLVDDDVSMLKAVGRLLKAAGFEVEKFHEPAAFLARLDELECPVVVLDVWMPEMSGLEVQAILREKAPRTRVIFMSGRDDPSVRQHAMQAGAFGFLLKPFKDEDLVELLEKATNGR